MQMLRSLVLTLLLAPFFYACNANDPGGSSGNGAVPRQASADLKKAYFASGCFWCVEHIYEKVKGVEEAVSGYAGGDVKDPSYHQVASGGTGHAETVKVLYDPEKVSFKTLVKIYYASQDPTTKGQEPDFGPQYRSIIFYTNEQEKEIARKAKDSVAASGAYEDPIVTELQKLEAFYPAKEHHQDYVEKNPDQGYVQRVSLPRYRSFKKKMPEVLK
ncbi:MAG: peptide-methionine (S)-S-oxide reductase MsrA [Flavobacteriales bacterium]